MKIYTDIDYVLHDYSISFLNEILKNINLKKIPKINLTGKYTSPLIPYIKAFDLNEKYTSFLVKKANLNDRFYPTVYFESIKNFIFNNNFDIIAITARPEREQAENIVKKCFEKKITTISLEAKYKYLAIEENSIYFEDNLEAVYNVAKNRKNVTIIVPKWPWNLDIPKKNNIIHLDVENSNETLKLIKERLF